MRRADLNGKSSIRRARAGRGFNYQDARGRMIRNGATLQRIKSLAVPPAWEEVWISSSATAHLQAVGRDARHRKQYVYHPEWRARQDEDKYHRILRFARELPRIRRRLRRDLQAEGLGLTKVLATVVALLDCSLIRIGNAEYARQNGSYGLTTLLDKHVDIESASVHFHFRGKSGQLHSIEVRDAKLARIVRQCRHQPGRHLFQYRDDAGKRHKLMATEVNNYLRGLSQAEFSAKDFRTWSATVLMIAGLGKLTDCTSMRLAKRNVKSCLARVAERLGNTPSVCRKSYVPEIVLETYLQQPRAILPVARCTVPRLCRREAGAYTVLERLLRRKGP